MNQSPPSPYPCQHLSSFVFLDLSHSDWGKMEHVVVLIDISLMVQDVEECLSISQSVVFPLWELLVQFFASSFNWIGFFYV